MDQLLIDNCIMDEVRKQQRNLSVAYYGYRKTCDNVDHDWMLRVYNWIGIPKGVISVFSELMKRWKTRLEVWDGNDKSVSRWINISCGFLLGDSHSPVGFCLTEILVCILLSETRGYRMSPRGKREVKKTHTLFMDDLKVYQEGHQQLVAINEMLVQASNDTGACYGISKCAEIVFEHGKMVKGEGLKVLEERMQALDRIVDDTHRFLGIEQGEGIKAKVKTEIQKRLISLTSKELYDKNLIRAINNKVVPVAAYPMNVCNFSEVELKGLDQMIKTELRSNNMLGRQSSED